MPAAAQSRPRQAADTALLELVAGGFKMPPEPRPARYPWKKLESGSASTPRRSPGRVLRS